MTPTADLMKLVEAVEAARSYIGPERPDPKEDPEDAELWDNLTKAAAALSSTGEARVGWEVAVCDGKEQQAFEAWARGCGFDMATHPLHWLFTNERTYAARQGWKAAIAYCALATPAQPKASEVQHPSDRPYASKSEMKRVEVLRDHPKASEGKAGGEPDPELLISMAVCLDHGFGLRDAKWQESRLREMRKLWDEVMGRGFYSPERKAFYRAMTATLTAPGADDGQ